MAITTTGGKRIDVSGSGGMEAGTYDTDADNVVDNAELLQGQNSAYHLARANHTGTQALTTLADQAANTVLVEQTGSSAPPTALAMAASTFLARLAAGNIVAATTAQATALLDAATTSLQGLFKKATTATVDTGTADDEAITPSALNGSAPVLSIANTTGTRAGIDSDATTHAASNGSSHTFIDQDVTSGASPTFDGANITGIPGASAALDVQTDTSESTYTGDTTAQVKLTSAAIVVSGSQDVEVFYTFSQKQSNGGSTCRITLTENKDGGGDTVIGTVDTSSTSYVDQHKMKPRSLTTGSHVYKVKYETTNGSHTCSIKDSSLKITSA